MSHLRQDQRWVMEKLFEGQPVLPSGLHTIEHFILVVGQPVPLYFLGISEGFGICSRIKGVNVAVFGLQPYKQQTEMQPFSYAFLLRPAEPKEMTVYQQTNYMAVEVVERLTLTNRNCTQAFLGLSGSKGSYVNRCM